MPRPIEREYRNRKLTPEEAAKYKEIRRLVEEEFKPIMFGAPMADGPLTQSLREALRSGGTPPAQIAQRAGLATDLVEDFIAGKRDIRMITADRLARAMGLKLSIAGSKAA